jgi:hypothetical protein
MQAIEQLHVARNGNTKGLIIKVGRPSTPLDYSASITSFKSHKLTVNQI